MTTITSYEDAEVDNISMSDITVQNVAPANVYTEEFEDIESDELDSSEVIVVLLTKLAFDVKCCILETCGTKNTVKLKHRLYLSINYQYHLDKSIPFIFCKLLALPTFCQGKVVSRYATVRQRIRQSADRHTDMLIAILHPLLLGAT